jgi:hypothetical protein
MGTVTLTYVRATLTEAATALAALTDESNPLAEPGVGVMTALGAFPLVQQGQWASGHRYWSGCDPRTCPRHGPTSGGPGTESGPSGSGCVRAVDHDELGLTYHLGRGLVKAQVMPAERPPVSRSFCVGGAGQTRRSASGYPRR